MQQIFDWIRVNSEVAIAPVTYLILVLWLLRDASKIKNDERSNHWHQFRRAGYTERALYNAMILGFIFLIFYVLKDFSEHVKIKYLDDTAVIGMGVTLFAALAACLIHSLRRVLQRGIQGWTSPKIAVFFSAVFAPFGMVATLREVFHEAPDAVKLLHRLIVPS